jgi:hypothetical protein
MNPQRILWDNEGSDEIAYLEYPSNIIVVYDIPNNVSRSTHTFSGSDWIPRQNNIVSVITSSIQITPVQSTLGSLVSRAMKNEQKLPTTMSDMRWFISDVYQENLLLRSPSSTELIILSPDDEFSIPVHTILNTSPDLPLLAKNDLELWQYQKNVEPTMIYRSSEKMINAAALNKNDLYLIALRDRLIAFQSFYGIRTELLNNILCTDAHALPDKRLIIFSGSYKGTDGLWSLAY